MIKLVKHWEKASEAVTSQFLRSYFSMTLSSLHGTSLLDVSSRSVSVTTMESFLFLLALLFSFLQLDPLLFSFFPC